MKIINAIKHLITEVPWQQWMADKRKLRSSVRQPKRATRQTKTKLVNQEVKRKTRGAKKTDKHLVVEISASDESLVKKPLRRPVEVKRSNKPTANTRKRQSIEKKQDDRENLSNNQRNSDADFISSPSIASQLLHQFSINACSLPEKLPCREEEFDYILEQILVAIQDGQGGCLYISGVPGTGKTATVKQVVHMLQAAVENNELDPFRFVEINGMTISETNQAYLRLYQGMFGRSAPLSKCTKLLDSHFRGCAEGGSDEPYTILLLDELDYLINKKQSLVYNFFEWPGLTNSRFIVVAIANTMDLPERLLSNKVASRLGMCRINFAPYTHPQLLEIVQFYLATHTTVFTKNALELMARKICAISGDARRLLEVAKRAIELAYCQSTTSQSSQEGTEQISVATVQRAIAEIFAASTSPKLLKHLSFHQQFMLVCIGNVVKRRGVARVSLQECIDCHAQFCRVYSVALLKIEDYFDLVKSLHQMKLIYSNAPSVNYALPLCMVSLAVPQDDINIAFGDDSFMKNLIAND